MIDGVQFTFYTPNPKTFLLSLPCWEILINEKSGERVNDIRAGHLRGLDMKLKPSTKGGFNFLINGSLHKFHNCGLHNADQFSFENLKQSIDSFVYIFGVDASQCFIHGLEIGINLELTYSPLKVIKNAVCFKSRPFTQINKRSARKGLQCTLTQYGVKFYDKAAQSGMDCGNILRIEVSVSRMQAIAKYSIETLEDLQKFEKVYPLVNLLNEALLNTIWTDTSVNLDRLSNREQKQWLSFSNPRTWQALGKYKRNRAIKSWDNLLNKYGNPPKLHQHIADTWDGLFGPEMKAYKPQPFYATVSNYEALETATLLPLECTVKRSPLNVETNINHDAGFSITKNNNSSKQRNKCLTCDRDISKQRKGSLFCAESQHGKKAKRCRNKNSNHRKNKKTKITRAIMQNNLLSITYADDQGNTFTDVLHPSEIVITKEWLDRIQQVVILPLDPNKPTT